MRVTLLGSVGLNDPQGTAIGLPSGKRLAVLALLALRLKETVPVAQFFDLVWDGDAPPQARAALQGHVAGLRKALDTTPFTIVTEASGYRLEGSLEDVDLNVFTRLVQSGTAAGDDAQAAELLDSALQLWFGDALMGLPDCELLRIWRPQLEERRLTALQEWADRLLALGRGGEAVQRLEAAHSTETGREPLVARLVFCLHQAGRQSDALEVYHTSMKWLRTELGVVPGEELQSAFDAVLRQQVPAATVTVAPRAAAAPSPSAEPAPVPSQLPLVPRGLVGRQPESNWLDRECGPRADGTGLALVTGPAGVGKSALVVRWAHSVATGFPDGQLFVDLRGFDPDAKVSAHAALGSFLSGLGMRDLDIPGTEQARRDAFAELTARRKVLVVLDNASSVDTVRSLLPSGPGCATVVTSRVVLDKFVVQDGAAVRSLTPLSEEDALDLVEHLAGARRCDEERDEARRLVALCDRLPLALRIAGARLSTNPAWSIADLVTELEDEHSRLQALSTAGAASVPSALNSSYAQLTDEAARLLALLALYTGTEVDRLTAAALLGSGPGTADAALGVLTSHHLVTEIRPGRFGRHDLVRLYSEGLLADLPAAVRDEARDRLLDYLLAATAVAGSFQHAAGDKLNGPHGWQPHALPRIGDHEEAWRWFGPERSAVLSLIHNRDVDPARAWQLADNCINMHHGHTRDGAHLEFAEAGFVRAQACGDKHGQVQMLFIMGMVKGDYAGTEQGLAHLLPALQIASELPLAVHRVRLRLGAGHFHLRTGDLGESQRLVKAALEESKELDHVYARALSASNLSQVLLKAEDPAGALHYAREACELLPRSTSFTAVVARLNQADALRELGDLHAAESCLRSAIDICRAAGHLYYRASAEESYATLLEDLGRHAEARQHRLVTQELLSSMTEEEYREPMRFSASISLFSREHGLLPE